MISLCQEKNLIAEFSENFARKPFHHIAWATSSAHRALVCYMYRIINGSCMLEWHLAESVSIFKAQERLCPVHLWVSYSVSSRDSTSAYASPCFSLFSSFTLQSCSIYLCLWFLRYLIRRIGGLCSSYKPQIPLNACSVPIPFTSTVITCMFPLCIVTSMEAPCKSLHLWPWWPWSRSHLSSLAPLGLCYTVRIRDSVYLLFLSED